MLIEEGVHFESPTSKSCLGLGGRLPFEDETFACEYKEYSITMNWYKHIIRVPLRGGISMILNE